MNLHGIVGKLCEVKFQNFDFSLRYILIVFEELGQGHFLKKIQWKWMQLGSHYFNHRTPLGCPKGIANNM